VQIPSLSNLSLVLLSLLIMGAVYLRLMLNIQYRALTAGRPTTGTIAHDDIFANLFE